MKSRHLVLALLLAVPACPKAEAPAPAPPAPAPPAPAAAAPDFASPPPVKSAMWSMAVATNRIVDVLNKEGPPTAAELADVKGVVDDIAKIADGLAVDPAAQKHPLIRRGIAGFRTQITLAQAGLAKDPADLAPAKQLAVSCRECHARGAAAVPFKL